MFNLVYFSQYALPSLDLSTELLLNSLETDTDPFNIGLLPIEPEPSISSQPPPPPTITHTPPVQVPSITLSRQITARIPPPPPAGLPPPPPPVSLQQTGPQRNKHRRKNTSAETIHRHYAHALDLVNNGTSTADAIKNTGLPKSTFYKWKPIAELKIMDADQFRYHEEDHADPAVLLMSCKATTLEERYLNLAKEMRKNGDLLKRS